MISANAKTSLMMVTFHLRKRSLCKKMVKPPNTAINLYVAFNYDLETWVNFKVFGLTGLTLAFAIGSILSLYKYLPQETDEVAEVLEDSIEITSSVMSESPEDKK